MLFQRKSHIIKVHKEMHMPVKKEPFTVRGVCMATSSIFANFNITDKKTAEAFVAALDASAHDPKRKPVAPVDPPLTDHAAIRAFLAKRKQDK